MRRNARASAALTGKELDEPAFSAAQCGALFAAVLIDDKIDADTALPEAIHLGYSQEQLTRAFRLCRQVWKEGVDRADFRRIVNRIGAHRPLSAEDRLAFKHGRAKFKHLRFAFATFDERHRYPFWFDLITRIMGQLQDAFKNNRAPAMRNYKFLLRLFLMRIPFASVIRETDRFYPTTPEDFRAHVLQQIGQLREVLARQDVTAKEFHETRKIISRQVALYDNMRVLYPSAYHEGVSRYLAAINGLMGGLHDELIKKKIGDRKDYHAETFRWPDEIRRRLTELVKRYPHSA